MIRDSLLFQQATQQCFCGNKFGSLGQADREDCAVKCTGASHGSTAMCGYSGAHRNAVYDTTAINLQCFSGNFFFLISKLQKN